MEVSDVEYISVIEYYWQVKLNLWIVTTLNKDHPLNKGHVIYKQA